MGASFKRRKDQFFYELSSEDITKLSADVLVLRLGDELSNYFYKKSNFTKEIFEEINLVNDSPISIDSKIRAYLSQENFSQDFITTSAYDMPYQHIIHAMIPRLFNDTENILVGLDYTSNITNMTKNILYHAVNTLKANSIVIGLAGFFTEYEYNYFNEVTRVVNVFVKKVFPYLKVVMAVIPINRDESIREYKESVHNPFMGIPISEFVKKQHDSELSISTPNDSDYIKKETINMHNMQSYVDKRMDYMKELKQMRQESSFDDQQFAKMIISDYLLQYKGKQATLAELVGCDKSEISRYRNGKHIPKSKDKMIALALAMELKQKDMYMFMNGAGYKYPVDERDNIIELLHEIGEYDFHIIKQKIEEMTNKPLVKDKYAVDEKKQR